MLSLLALLFACADKGDATCDAVNAGEDWQWSGECPQMVTPCDLVVEGCEISIDYEADGGMTMGMPYAGTIDGDAVTFQDGDSVTGCEGVVEDADTITGSCVLDGEPCTFTLER